MRKPLGTYFARPPGHDSFSNETLLKMRLLNLYGTVADIICCQMLWCHSLASVDEAVNTIRGEATGEVSSQVVSSNYPAHARNRGRLRSAQFGKWSDSSIAIFKLPAIGP